MDSELWKKEREALSTVLKEKIVGNKTSFTYDVLLQKELPDFLRIYLKTQARRFLQEEKPMTWNQSDRYQLDDPQVRENFERLMGVLLLKTKFTKDEIKRWIELAIKFQLEVLVRPKEAMASLFFRREKVRKRDDLVKMVKQLAQRRPYMLHLVELLKESGEQIDTSSFSYLARKAEEETYGTKPLAAFLIDVRTFESFFNLSDRKNGSLLTTEVIVGLLRERNLSDVADGIQELSVSRETDFWTYEEVETALERQLVLRGLSEEDNGSLSSKDVSRGKKSKAAGAKSDNVSSQILEDAILEARSAVSFNSFLENLFIAQEAKIEEEIEPEKKQVPPRITFGGVEEDEGVFVVHRRNIEKQPPGPYPSLRSLISHKERKVFIKKLFDKDKGSYHAFIDSLEDTDKWKEAKLIIDDELNKRQLSPFCREAVRLGDLVFSRYFSKKP